MKFVFLSLALIATEAQASPVATLESRYQASQKVSEVYKPSREEIRDSERVFSLADPIIMEQEYRALIEKYPQSPEIYVDFCLFLDRRKKTSEAARLSADALTKFPNSVRLAILADSMKALASTRDKRKKTELREELDALFAAWNKLVTENKRSKKKKFGVSVGQSD